MVSVVKLNLPPPDSIRQELINYLNNTVIDPDGKRWLDEFHGNSINSAVSSFFSAPEDWQTRITQLYQSYFDKHEISIVFAAVKNPGSKAVCLPPHTDRARGLAINYYLELGGPNVDTVFYNYYASTLSHQATNFLYSAIGEPVSKIRFEQGWYAYNVDQVHSVENINSNRYILILLLKTTEVYHLENLLLDYPQLIEYIHE